MLIIDKLWRDGLSPSERYTKKNSQYDKILHKLCEEEDKLLAELSETGKKNLEAYHELSAELFGISEEETFVKAFRLGAKFILDIFANYSRTFYSLDGNDPREEN